MINTPLSGRMSHLKVPINADMLHHCYTTELRARYNSKRREKINHLLAGRDTEILSAGQNKRELIFFLTWTVTDLLQWRQSEKAIKARGHDAQWNSFITCHERSHHLWLSPMGNFCPEEAGETRISNLLPMSTYLHKMVFCCYQRFGGEHGDVCVYTSRMHEGVF